MSKGLMTCIVCGRDFALIEEEHYVARDNEQKGIVNAIADKEGKLYDAFDCPHCGCQNILQERKRGAIEALIDNEDFHDGCEGCKHYELMEDDFPCVDCSENHPDRWEEKDGAE